MSGHCCDNLIVDVLVKGCKKKIYINSVLNIIKGNAVEVKNDTIEVETDNIQRKNQLYTCIQKIPYK